MRKLRQRIAGAGLLLLAGCVLNQELGGESARTPTAGSDDGLAEVKYDRDDPDARSVEVSIPLDDRGKKARELNELLKKKQ